MAGKRIDIVLVKLCAVILVVTAMQELTIYISFYVSAPPATAVTIMAVLLNFVLPLLIALALWTFPATIIGSVSSDTSDGSPEPDWVVISVTLMCLYVLIFGIIDLAFYESFRAAERAYVDPNQTGMYTPSPESVAGRFTNIVQIVIGLLLLAGKRGIARLIRAARYSG